MATLEELQAAERRLRELIHGEGLPQPDSVEYEAASLLFKWEEQKLAIVVDMDERGDPSTTAAVDEDPAQAAD